MILSFILLLVLVLVFVFATSCTPTEKGIGIILASIFFFVLLFGFAYREETTKESVLTEIGYEALNKYQINQMSLEEVNGLYKTYGKLEVKYWDINEQ